MKQILPANDLPKETVAAIMMRYGNTQVKVHSPDGNTDYFDIVAGVLQGDTLAPYIRGAYDKFPDFFRMSTFIDSTHMKL